ncbi:Laccase-1 [Vitis vinifera]|uniref:Laccase-1 n=1 Tax=Vitis vinifera TaxID=29760 RepID=A0A438C2G3_VITVI|nr:Laccase-1 [Vitis vinifera]
MPYPFKAPIQDEVPIIFGEWWNDDAEEVEREMMRTGDGPKISEAYTINGMPGPLYPCSKKDTFIQNVVPGKTYLLRIINAALNAELFFAIANHTLTVRIKFPTLLPCFPWLQTIMSPPFFHSIIQPQWASYATKLSQPKSETPKQTSCIQSLITLQSSSMKDTAFATAFSSKLRSLASAQYPCNVPKTIDKRIVTTISLNLQDCPANQTCKGYNGKRFFASMNNQSFIRPFESILECHYKNLTNNLFSSDFPEKPPTTFDYTGVNPFTSNMNTQFGTKLLVVPYGSSLEIVMQGTSFLSVENHPIHFHGHNFFIVGRGFGNFDVNKDPQNYNLVDPPERNTVAVPTGGWAAIRFKADNPGVWFIHCHLEEHTSWGLAMGLVVQNGPNPSQCLLPPPADLPSC